MKVIIVHSWDANPESDWHPWLKKELEAKNAEVIIPEMPNTEEPKIEEWVNKLKEISGELDENTFFIGHSIGCQAILRYLETLPEEVRVNKVILVAPWMRLTDKIYELEGEETKKIAEPWVETPIDWEKVKLHANDFVAIFSNNDPYVAMIYNSTVFEEDLSAKIVVEKDKGHMNAEFDILELPVILEELFE